jgi:hypothetical protein
MCQALREIMKEDFEEVANKTEERTSLDYIRNLMESTNWSAKKAMDALKIPAPLQAEYASKL